MMAGDYSTQATEGDLAKLSSKLEALLFASPGPAKISQLASVLQITPRRAEKALEALESALSRRGIRVQRHKDAVQLTTAPAFVNEVENFLVLESTSRLTRAALEVLAIVAYEQPVTRPQIDTVRGVNSDSAIRTLLRHGLIDEMGRTGGPGRPILYGTTPEFLGHFGLASLDQLPPLIPEQPE
jgi:segregation and condensation protein B